jgi:hypothetical protein
MLIHRRTGGLDEVDIVPAHAFLDFDMQLAIQETMQGATAQPKTQLISDGLSQG